MRALNPYTRHEVVDLSSGNVTFDPPTRAIVIGTAGVVNGIQTGMGAAAPTASLPPGLYTLQFRQINQSGTTAGQITALW